MVLIFISSEWKTEILFVYSWELDSFLMTEYRHIASIFIHPVFSKGGGKTLIYNYLQTFAAAPPGSAAILSYAFIDV